MQAGIRKSITKEKSVAILEQEIKRLLPKVTDKYGNITQNQATALVSILYNTPMKQDIVKNEDVVQMFQTGDRVGLDRYFERQICGVENHAGVRLNGLRTRRAEELNLYFQK